MRIGPAKVVLVSEAERPTGNLRHAITFPGRCIHKWVAGRRWLECHCGAVARRGRDGMIELFAARGDLEGDTPGVR